MDLAKQTLQLDLEYSEWATRRLLRACAALTVVEQTRDLGQSHRSILRTLNHVYDSERFWSECLHANEMPFMDDSPASDVEPALQVEELETAWPGVWRGLRQWLVALMPGELTQTLRGRFPGGREIHFARWQLLRHSVNHATLHRGQVLGMLRVLGQRPPNVDVLTFYAFKHE